MGKRAAKGATLAVELARSCGSLSDLSGDWLYSDEDNSPQTVLKLKDQGSSVEVCSLYNNTDTGSRWSGIVRRDERRVLLREDIGMVTNAYDFRVNAEEDWMTGTWTCTDPTSFQGEWMGRCHMRCAENIHQS